ncbi:hypothetical protein BASA60_010809 [Batrachochytrium salamandrivorans]|nr:hypothetical protein BASA60_010809 [Batrachochytrium salamandrivorans]
MLEHTVTESAPISTLEPKASLPRQVSTEQGRISGALSINSSSSFSFKQVDTTRIGKMIAMLGTLLTGNALRGTIRTWRNQIFSIRSFDLAKIQGKLTADIDWNDAALRSQFYHGLSSEIKDALVHFDNPSSVSAAMDLAIRIDNRFLKDARNKRFSIRDLHSVILQQLQYFLDLEISSSNKDSLSQNNLQIQASQTLSSTPLPLDHPKIKR